MNTESLCTLGYEEIKGEVTRYAVSYEGKRLAGELAPMVYLPAIQRALEETEEAKELLERGASVPLPSLEGMEWIISLMGTGYLYNEQDFTAIATFLNSCSQLRKYMASKEQSAPRIAAYGASLQELRQLRDEIERCIRFGVIESQASKGLERVRKRLTVAKERLQRKLESIMSRHQSILQESLVSMRGGRYVIPVKREYHKQVKGAVLDQSTSGQTVFVEPYEVAALQGELELLTAEEAREEGIILSMLSGLVEREQEALRINIEVTGTYDFIFAKAKYARSIGARNVKLNERGWFRMNGGRHPELKDMVPVSLEFGHGYKSLIVTGPNTGGKTVVLKTLGLLAAMAQSGLLVPVEEHSDFAVFRDIISVIGDGQSLTQSLSTFSAQMKSIEGMLRAAGRDVLLLIDELAAGTDPGEGFALSIAILEELNRKGANIIVTTHFNELKAFAASTPGFENARMEFDKHTLQPLYKLTIGEAGESYALQIAEKLGIPAEVIRRSHELAEQQRTPGGRISGAGRKAAIKPNPGYKTPGSTEGGFQEEKEDSSHLKNGKTADSGFEIGDAVYITSLDRTGIVYARQDSMGIVGVMVQKEKMRINHKRLKPYLSKDKLYPEDYDFDILFESKENRKKRKLMRKRHVEGLSVIHTEEET
ncbi:MULTISPECIES: DNA mismatch repair protein MutS [unclassified Paenibacillus]|uniref:endonuclease MutS2 n=1 Tax=unclassified Paenibacillus TaxID=185978 RepID=UPI002405DA8C|nr:MULTISPECIES: DNA mismatch repair protein MutS [unclassified Paenibacillus]MDF9839717.1 DNA mismatch repair protein MutS2 [Paenibacillus sp. PastF-2]MDF9846297.1 DNA mismatch repair protein MutS2 [Paenibacillus sp. PastM-2]MDF9853353.1 DNA mismatch repair protein MutS2 [Paenibacillus sp. PastF-1]MDH6478143.1 DNA mismatch repair protein MutS2 [Paenibacillus sp. PastH-2]MDH6506358.1 DNA mismatch repair protein MutS2 [Paenibacillus sp. PastM-3]